jgi:hypothetical protein
MEITETPQPDNQMGDTELLSILGQHEMNALGYQGSDNELTSEQERTLDYYNGKMDDVPAQTGSSSVVDGTVALVVDNALAAILKPFVSSDETVTFAPRGPEDVAIAEQATEYVNYIFNVDNPGFLILHNWFKDALLSKLGVVKVVWEDHTRNEVMAEVPLEDVVQAEIVRSDPSYLGEEGGVAFLGQVVEDGRVKIECVPPEEFRISQGARDVETAIYTAHVPVNVTRSDLIEMGFDPEIVEGLPAYTSSGNDSTLRDARYSDENYHDARVDAFHKSNDRMALRDEYVRIDYDGDGVAELRRIVRVNDTILLNEEVEENPFATICPIPMPHKVFGFSIADRAVQEQRIGTVLWRQALDNLYKTNNPRPIVGEAAERADGSTADSLEDNAPGAAIMVRDASAFRLADSVPFFAASVFPMMELLDKKTEENTGVSRAGQGLDTNALRKSGQMTATEMSMIAQGKNARTEMVARIFAETGVSRLFRLILGIVSKYQPQERIIRLRNQWVPIDPRGWPEMDVAISVGIGIGDKSEQIQMAATVLDTMERLAGTPYATMLDDKRVYNAVQRLFTAAGVKNTDDFLIEPKEDEQEQGPPQPSPEEMQAQAEMQMQQAKLEGDMAMQQAKMQGEQQLAQMRIELQREEAAAKAQLDRERAEFEAQLARDKAQFEAELALEKMQLEQRLRQQQATVSMSVNRPGGDLDK